MQSDLPSEVIVFFAVVERIYSFLPQLTDGPCVLVKHVPTALKRVTDTRWSAHYASVKAFHIGIDGAVDALDQCFSTPSPWTQISPRKALDESAITISEQVCCNTITQQ